MSFWQAGTTAYIAYAPKAPYQIPESINLFIFFSKNLHVSKIYSIFAAKIVYASSIMGYSNHDKLEWILIFSLEFGRRYGLTLKQAFNYLKQYKGIEFIEQHYDYVHTQSFQSMIADIAEYCHRKGGKLV